jgi:hypothetical protein
MLLMSKDSAKPCIEDPRSVEIRKTIQAFEKKFTAYMILSIVYGLVFVNYIDNISGGYEGYHLWLLIMYFFPFIALTVFYPRNWQLTIGLGLVTSIMNDLFYGVVRNLMGFTLNLKWYYTAWLIPSNTFLFQMNLGFAILQVLSWMMAISIYARIIAVFFLLKSWRAQAKIRCLTEAQARKSKPLKIGQPPFLKYSPHRSRFQPLGCSKRNG